MGFTLCPAGISAPELPKERAALDPLIQVRQTGDFCRGGYAPGTTLRCAESAMRLTLKEQALQEQGSCRVLKTTQQDPRGFEAVHTVSREEGDPFLRLVCSYENQSAEPVTLELLSSFSLTGLSPYLAGDGSGALTVHRLQSRWSQEGRLQSQTLEELQLEPSRGMDAVRFGASGRSDRCRSIIISPSSP